MPQSQFPNMAPYLNLVALVFALVAEILKAWVRNQSGNGNGHA